MFILIITKEIVFYKVTLKMKSKSNRNNFVSKVAREKGKMIAKSCLFVLKRLHKITKYMFVRCVLWS